MNSKNDKRFTNNSDYEGIPSEPNPLAVVVATQNFILDRARLREAREQMTADELREIADSLGG